MRKQKRRVDLGNVSKLLVLFTKNIVSSQRFPSVNRVARKGIRICTHMGSEDRF